MRVKDAAVRAIRFYQKDLAAFPAALPVYPDLLGVYADGDRAFRACARGAYGAVAAAALQPAVPGRVRPRPRKAAKTAEAALRRRSQKSEDRGQNQNRTFYHSRSSV